MSHAFGAGDRVGPYRLVRLLGGGMSSVFEAVHVADGRRIALKILRNDAFASDAALRRRFEREVRAQRAVSHPSLPELIDAGDVDGVPYLCTPFVDGVTLAAHVARRLASGHPGPIDVNVVGVAGLCLLFAEVADALHALHQAGFVHRDVKPANVLVDASGHAFLLDLGLVRMEDDALHRLTRTGHVVGTPAMLAPEQLDPRRGRIGPWTDVHGLAATLHTCLTLRPPFAESSPAAIFDRILHDAPPDPRAAVPGLSRHITVLLRHALAKDPAARHATAAALAADLRRVAADRAPVRAPLRPLAAAMQGLRGARHAARAIALLAAFALLVPGEAGGQRRSGSELVDAAALAAAVADVVARLEVVAPPWPEHEPELARAIVDAEALVARRADVAHALAEADPGERALLEQTAGALRDVDDRILPDAIARRAWAHAVADRAAAEHAGAWAAAAACVAADPRFEGFDLAPQVALVPLGVDPSSGLCEFHDLASAARGAGEPRRDATGQLLLGPEHGMVLVLIPPPAAGQPPFLIGKHEVTRAQWIRLSGGPDPSHFPVGAEMRYGHFGPTHPVDRVAWIEAARHLGRWGFTLPTGRQWQSAATAGDPGQVEARGDDLAARANIVDRSFVRDNARAFQPTGDDGYVLAAPVGSFAPNAFGLYDTLGNLWEWTAERDSGSSDSIAIARGGAFDTVPEDCRVDYRFQSPPDQRLDNVGLRAARELRRLNSRGGP